ncbi:MAG: hypothetical protein DRP01_00105 [Archaeoglobales archaeon]|nr:MAG: hypothetical protein DRP01_00105 [Archaeoglobales archaeon]
MVGVYLTTTGTLDPIVIDDMGALTFPHPTVAYNLLLDVTEDEIQSSEDLQTLVTAGHVTLADDAGDPITDVHAAGPHHHPIGDVDNLQTELAAKADTPHGTADHTGIIGTHAQISVVGVDDHHAEDHAARHADGGADAVKLDDLATPDDNTDLDSSTSRHGLLPKLGGGTSDFLRADGTWVVPAGSGPNVDTVSTVGAIVTTISTIPIPDDTVLLFKVSVVGRRTDAPDRAMYVRCFGVYRESAGVATLEGALQTLLTRESAPGWDCTVSVSGNNVLVQVLGGVGHSVDWKCEYFDGVEVS